MVLLFFGDLTCEFIGNWSLILIDEDVGASKLLIASISYLLLKTLPLVATVPTHKLN